MMNSSKTDSPDRAHELDREIKRYRDAAELALEQLEWVVSYFRKIRRPELATALERNRKQISEEIHLNAG
jgi:hypothetical protein